MCSVVGYVGEKGCRQPVLDGLSRLEYRGYDSAGFACISDTNGQLCSVKSQGGLEQLHQKIAQQPIDGTLGIGHTRWATHGVASDSNAHPHFDCGRHNAVVHNGIIENFRELKEGLVAEGHIFISNTDTEVIAHLIESEIEQRPLIDAACRTVKKLDGAYAFIALMERYKDVLLAVRKRSPLCIGIGENEIFVASDVLAFAGHAHKVVYIPDESFAIVHKDFFELYSFSGERLVPHFETPAHAWHAGDKHGYAHFMLKEIYEQKRVISNTVQYLKNISAEYEQHMGVSGDFLAELSQVYFIGCGTSWHAGKIAQYFFEEVALIPARSVLASEFRYQHIFSEPRALYLAISQSGETADTLEAVRLVNETGMRAVALTNVGSSSIVRESAGFLLTQAGQEIAVASTKAFTAQVATLFWLAHRVALQRGIISGADVHRAEEDLLIAGTVLENSIEQYKREITEQLAALYARATQFIFIGRHIAYPFALEAALKLKEISYRFVDCYPAGELKHGALALVDAEVPVFVFSSLDSLIYQKLVAGVQEVKARSGHVVAFAFEGQHELIELADRVFVFPRVHRLLAPLAMIGLVQFFAYQIALSLGRPIDKPRNLAKSVTVE